MSLDRIKKAEQAMQLRKELRPDEPDWDSMSDAELEPFIIRGLQGEIKTIKNICDHHSIDITNSQGFIEGLKIYKEKYCSDEGKLFYSDELITLLGQLFDEHKERLTL